MSINGATLEVFCNDRGCGEEEVIARRSVAAKSRGHRKMNYVGKESKKSTEHYYYQCPVCGNKRMWEKKGDLLDEVSLGTMAYNNFLISGIKKMLIGIAVLLVIMFMMIKYL